MPPRIQTKNKKTINMIHQSPSLVQEKKTTKLVNISRECHYLVPKRDKPSHSRQKLFSAKIREGIEQCGILLVELRMKWGEKLNEL